MDLASIDKKSSEQLYLQIRRLILRAIQEGELSPLAQMPSIAELSQTTGVSRMTVRHALEALVNEGWLYTVPGKGTFVSQKPTVEQNLQNLMGWTDEIRAQGYHPSTRIVSTGIVHAEEQVVNALQIARTSLVYRFVRVRLAEAFPLALESAHIPVERFPGLDEYIRQGLSLYHALDEHFGVQPVRASQVMEAGAADRITAELLRVPNSAPVLLTERITYAADDTPIEFVQAKHRSGLVRFRTELSGDSLASRSWVREIDVTRMEG
jgi:GntR family transcriptional regulator